MALKTKYIYYKCKKCNDKIFWNTHKKMIYCKCGAIVVDGCEYYVRLIGNQEDFQEVND